MSDTNTSNLSERLRVFRSRAKISQDELAARLGVSGNYISMIELGKKLPGPSLNILFKALELAQAAQAAMESVPGPAGAVPSTSVFSLMSTETLIRTFEDVAKKLSQMDPPTQKQASAHLREMLDELESRNSRPA